jgi:hypothetical protein
MGERSYRGQLCYTASMIRLTRVVVHAKCRLDPSYIANHLVLEESFLQQRYDWQKSCPYSFLSAMGNI